MVQESSGVSGKGFWPSSLWIEESEGVLELDLSWLDAWASDAGPAKSLDESTGYRRSFSWLWLQIEQVDYLNLHDMIVVEIWTSVLTNNIG